VAKAKSDKSTKDQNKVVTAVFTTTPKNEQNIRFVTIATVVAVVVIIIGLFWLHDRHTAKKVSINLSDTKLSSQQLIEDVGQLEAEGKTAEAQKLISEQSGSSSSQPDQFLAAQVQANSGNVQQALTTEENDVKQNGITESLAETMAGQAASLKQYSAAVSYYYDAIALLRNAPAALNDQKTITYYQDQINKLEALELASPKPSS
jgi:hypothetical protein